MNFNKMNRRDFITGSLYTTGGFVALSPAAAAGKNLLPDGNAVAIYLNHMSDAIERRIGALSGYIRALFTDSMSLGHRDGAGRPSTHCEIKNLHIISKTKKYHG
jgi:hypothetical protein